MTRQEANREIVKILTKEIEDAPDLRFTQILHNLSIIQMEDKYGENNHYIGSGVVDGYAEEPTKTLERVLYHKKIFNDNK